MSWPQHSNPSFGRAAHAPYNFVPLPEAVVEAPSDAGELPSHDEYHTDRHTGHFDVTLTTRSPLYIRAPLTLEEFRDQDADHEDFRDDPKNKLAFFHTRAGGPPVIPGSSLHGMLRSLVEIVSYGKVRKVTDRNKIFYRAVAASKSDPLKEPYDNVLGEHGGEVRAGYLEEQGGSWCVHPARRKPHPSGALEQSFIKVEDDLAEKSLDHLSDFTGFDHPKYEPQYVPVTYEYKKVKKWYYKATALSAKENHPSGDDHSFEGVLTSSGNMNETGGGSSPRRYHALVMERDPGASPLKISDQAVRDYKEALTSFQQEDLPGKDGDPERGCLEVGRPIFYVEPGEGEEILYFGHSPNFRIPATTAGEGGEKRAVTPRDFVPKALREPAQIDYAEALFGYAGSDRAQDASSSRASARAGRVSVTDATLEEDAVRDGLWLDVPDAEENALVPSILSSPKPTCFPHYLVQESDSEKHLRHYDSKTPDQTVIRGHKRYWHRGDVGADQIEEQDDDWLDDAGNVEAGSTQHTQMRPLQSGVAFSFRVEFENLTDAELGALCWALNPQGDPEKKYCHHLGMGKPLGMGAVELAATLHLDDRRERYASLFEEDGWASGERQAGPECFDELARTFEQEVLGALDAAGVTFADADKRLRDLGRIGMLLKMMEWPGPAAPKTAYMELDDFEDRPVLPDPSKFGALTGEMGLESSQASGPSTSDFAGQGTVKWFSMEKGYGFIDDEGTSEDVFLHKSERPSGQHPQEDELLSYKVVETDKGFQAEDARRA